MRKKKRIFLQSIAILFLGRRRSRINIYESGWRIAMISLAAITLVPLGTLFYAVCFAVGLLFAMRPPVNQAEFKSAFGEKIFFFRYGKWPRIFGVRIWPVVPMYFLSAPFFYGLERSSFGVAESGNPGSILLTAIDLISSETFWSVANSFLLLVLILLLLNSVRKSVKLRAIAGPMKPEEE